MRMSSHAVVSGLAVLAWGSGLVSLAGLIQ